MRKEALPIGREGIYNETLGDLEKMATEDITVQMEMASQLKHKISKAEKRMADKKESELAKQRDLETEREQRHARDGAGASVST